MKIYTVKNVEPITVSNAKLTLPNGYKNVSASYDGKFVSYTLDNDLYICDNNGNQVKRVEATYGLAYKWLPDRNRIIITENHKKFSSMYVSIVALDIDKNTENKVLEIKNLPLKSSASQIELSPLTNIIYVKVDTPYRDRLYKIDIMLEHKQIYTSAKRINKILELKRRDMLLYESADNYVHIVDEKGTDKLLSKQKACLLGIDDTDRVYIGKIINNYISDIYAGNLENELLNWEHITPTVSVNRDKIFISPRTNSIFALDDNGSLTDLRKGYVTKNMDNLIAIEKNFMLFAKGTNISFKGYDENVASKVQKFFGF